MTWYIRSLQNAFTDQGINNRDSRTADSPKFPNEHLFTFSRGVECYVYFSYETVNDGEFHTVEFLMVGKNFTMRIDGGVSQTIINEGDRERLEVSDPLYFGGVPPDLKDSAYRKWHIRHTESFGGMIIKYLAISRCLSSNDNKTFKTLHLQKPSYLRHRSKYF